MAVKNTRAFNMQWFDWIIYSILLALSRPDTHGVTLPFYCGPGSVFGAFVCGGGFRGALERNEYLNIVIKEIDISVM